MAAVTDPYATPEEYKKAKTKSRSDDDGAITRQLRFVSDLYTIEAGQFFGKDAAVVSRTYYGNGYGYLYLDQEGDNCPGIAETAGVIIKLDEDEDGSFSGDSAWGANDYQLHPIDAAKGRQARPWNKIVIPRWSTKSVFPAGMPVQVTAKFGWPAVPAAVIEDVIEITAIWREESTRATGRMNEGDESIVLSPMAMNLLKRSAGAYRERSLV